MMSHFYFKLNKIKMKLGSLNIGNKLIVAPMAEVTDAPFRKIAKKMGAGLTFTQMVSADGVARGHFETLRFLTFARDEKPIGVQLLGNDPEIIKDAVKEIIKLKPDVIDINAGCPVKKVLSKNMGSALLNSPDLLGKIIRQMVDSANGIPILAKMRLGKDRNKINILENAKIAEDNGASGIIVHARTVDMQYSESHLPEWIKKVKESVNIPVIGNGSVFEPEDALNMLKTTGCDSVIVARGALGNPFLFSRFNTLIETGTDPGNPSIGFIEKTLLEHVELIRKEYGKILGLTKAKKNIIWYFKSLNGINYLIREILSANEFEQLPKVIVKHIENLKIGKYPENNKRFEIEKKFKQKVLFWLIKDDS